MQEHQQCIASECKSLDSQPNLQFRTNRNYWIINRHDHIIVIILLSKSCFWCLFCSVLQHQTSPVTENVSSVPLERQFLPFFYKPPIIKAHFSNVGLSVLIDLLASCLLLIINRVVVVTFEKHINENFHVFSCITSLFRCTYYAKTSRSSVVDHRLSI